ncbi:MAG: hypothetical protein R3F43_09300 [bacterium]
MVLRPRSRPALPRRPRSPRCALVPSALQDGRRRDRLPRRGRPAPSSATPPAPARPTWRPPTRAAPDAGVEYFTVDKDGEAWACRTAKRHGEGRLGNVFDGHLAFFAAAAPCPYTICPCTVPANRGMIAGVGPAA